MITIIDRNSFPQLKTRYKRGSGRQFIVVYENEMNTDISNIQMSTRSRFLCNNMNTLQDTTPTTSQPQLQDTNPLQIQDTTPSQLQDTTPTMSWPQLQDITPLLSQPIQQPIVMYQPILPQSQLQHCIHSIAAQFELEKNDNNQNSAIENMQEYQKFNSPMALSFFWQRQRKKLPKKYWQRKMKINQKSMNTSNLLSKTTFWIKSKNYKMSIYMWTDRKK